MATRTYTNKKAWENASRSLAPDTVWYQNGKEFRSGLYFDDLATSILDQKVPAVTLSIWNNDTNEGTIEIQGEGYSDSPSEG